MLQSHVCLQPYNTLNVKVQADYFAQVNSAEELKDALSLKKKSCPQAPVLILGGGSNVVLRGDFPGLVILNRIDGIKVIEETDDQVLVQVGAGENWDDFVAYSINQGWYGLENLSAIPGTVGAAPIQNIGAYGVELKDFFVSAQAMDRDSQQLVELELNQCQFGYRDSVFKGKLKDRYVICSVTLRLSKQPHLKLHYSDIPKRLADVNLEESQVTPLQLRQLVIAIRSEKLPNPDQLPNVGSFFKNPVVSAQEYERIKSQSPNLVAYPLKGGHYKLAAGWLIDQLGWKGRQWGDAQVHKNQALVLVNQGLNNDDLLGLAEAIQKDVLQHFGVQLEAEPQVI